MSNNQSQNPEGEGQELAFPTAELVAARERQGLSQNDVAHELRLSDKYIDALERAAFEELPSLVFARGYIRSYTKLLKLDEERFLICFDALYGRSGAAPNIRSAPGMQSSARLGDPMIKWSAWFFLLVVIAATIWWWKTQQGLDQPISQLPTTQSVEVESADGTTLIVPPDSVAVSGSASVVPPVTIKSDAQLVEGELEVQPSGELSIPLTVTGSVSVDEPTTEIVAEPAVEESVAAANTAMQAVTDKGTLRITFVDECWVSVEDHTGEVLAMRVKPAGSELTVSGVTPLKVLLGRASAVGEVVFDGKAVSFERNGRSGVVRLSLPQS
ncbi:RodZ domain-containing protein [Amphritea japonica]|uniref:Cytoskeleton protein RodZ n=1 Tax=Amphritea japonica ATCC BAA-1530 TaxID=1278309 RepID=A0A7R6PC96_9GAMM|nr:RodZ domain-containing protein [Amphritea japonica]BBB27382.1 cytoskeleton protein RodZ [Amphritea japonica ATCC BAA-1530]